MTIAATEKAAEMAALPKQIAPTHVRREIQLGLKIFQPQIDAKLDVSRAAISPTARQFWNEHKKNLLKMIYNGKPFMTYINKNAFPGPVRTDITDLCNLYYLSVRYGKLIFLFGKGKKFTGKIGKDLEEVHQENITNIATVERAFVREYASKSKEKLNYNQAWNELLKRDEFLDMLAAVGTAQAWDMELDLRKKYHLSTALKTRKTYIAKEFDAVAKQAIKAGFSIASINNARDYFKLPPYTIASKPVRNAIPPSFESARLAEKSIQAMQATAEEQEKRKRKQAEQAERRKQEEKAVAKTKAKPNKK